LCTLQSLKFSENPFNSSFVAEFV